MRGCCKTCVNLRKGADDTAICAKGQRLVYKSPLCAHKALGDNGLSSLRFCTKCGRMLPLSRFYEDKGRSDGYGVNCRDCRSRSAAERYKERHPHAKYERGRREVDLTGLTVGGWTAVGKVADKPRPCGFTARVYRWVAADGSERVTTRSEIARSQRRKKGVAAWKPLRRPSISAKPYRPECPEQFNDEFMMITKLLV